MSSETMNIHKRILGVMAALLFVFTPQVFAKPKESLVSLFVGGSKVVNAGNVTRMVVGSGDIISTKLLTTGQLVITAEEEGTTNIHLWGEGDWEHEIMVYVLPVSATRTTAEVSALLSDVEGLTVKSVAGRTVLEGNIFERDKPLVETAMGLYPDVVNLTRVSNAFSEKMIYMEVQITEFSTSDLENLGINWSTSIPGPNLAYGHTYNQSGAVYPTEYVVDDPSYAPFSGTFNPLSFSSNGTYFGLFTEITSRLNFLVSTGNAFMLASPRLSARSGGEAEFLAGGQVPVITSSINGSSVEYKDFGIKLNIAPSADSLGNITARVSTEVSSIDAANSVDGVPGFKTRFTSTDVNMRDGETLVISGLMNSEMANSVDKVKWLSDIPVLGKLFQSKFFQAKETELVIFVTPTIVNVDHEINRQEAMRRDDMINRFNASFDDGILD
jgi:pilus assembly protein CpaC